MNGFLDQPWDILFQTDKFCSAKNYFSSDQAKNKNRFV
jgi:hypothetical protein